MQRLLLPALLAVSLHAAEAGSDFFETKVRPVLAERCFSCHTQTKLGGLEMTSHESLLTGGKSGPAIVPGKPAESRLVRMIRQEDPEVKKMPPAGAKLSAAEIAAIETWIKDGAVWPAAPPVNTSKNYVITDAQRQFWAFRPVKKPAGNIDSLLWAEMKKKGITAAAPADRRTLIRRATLDLTGLPATFQEVEAFIKDKSPDAWAKVVDRLLASSHYGERWGRIWLDVARYSDDKLNSTMNEPQPNAFRYRDWVIEAFNKDMPYDMFVKAQIAADHMEKRELLPGLGLYGLSPEFQDDRVDVTTRGFLALTVACAQCHDHKFDPIPTKDYYSLLGIFNSSKYKEYPLVERPAVEAYEKADKAWTRAKNDVTEYVNRQTELVSELLAAQADAYLLAAMDQRPLNGLDGETVQRVKAYLKRDDRQAPQLPSYANLKAAGKKELAEIATTFRHQLVEVQREKREIDQKNIIRLGGSNARRDLASADLLSLDKDKFYLYRDFFGVRGVLHYPDGKIDRWLPGPYLAHLEFLRQRETEAQCAVPSRYPFLHGLEDIEKPNDERVHLRGNKNTLGDVAPRQWLAILSNPEKPELFTKGSGRLQLAEHIASAKNPLTPRVMVNRIWQGHFGEGIVRTASNFGILGERPSHPELLDYLAARFVENQWSIKAMHREIMLSNAYQLRSASVAASEKIDAENRLFWRFPRRRLDAESIRDSVLFVTGQLENAASGPAVPLDNPNNKRRTVYGFVSRRSTDTMLNLFDFPNPNATSEKRSETNVPLQRLFLLNSPMMLQAAQALAERLEGDKATDAYRRILSRVPSKTEALLAQQYISGGGTWAEFVQVLLSSNEFLFLN